MSDLPPDAEEVRTVAGAFNSALRGVDGLSEVQLLVLRALTRSMTGVEVEYDAVVGVGPAQLGDVLADRPLAYRRRIVQMMLIGELLVHPLPPEVSHRVERYAEALGVRDDMLDVTRQLASQAYDLALVDFERSGYEGNWDYRDYADSLHTHRPLEQAWSQIPDDPELAAQWAALEVCAPGTLGRRVWEFYRARGFSWPGTPDSAPPLLAQHDWLHVLADYGSTVESEVEVFSFIARANDDPQAFSLQAMVLSLFETGCLDAGPALFAVDPGHLSRSSHETDRMATRLADAMYRGSRCRHKDDLLKVDWFAHADRDVDEVREELGIVAKSAAARAAGSVGPWERGGITPFQFAQGRSHAEALGVAYDSYGARPDEG